MEIYHHCSRHPVLNPYKTIYPQIPPKCCNEARIHNVSNHKRLTLEELHGIDPTLLSSTERATLAVQKDLRQFRRRLLIYFFSSPE